MGAVKQSVPANGALKQSTPSELGLLNSLPPSNGGLKQFTPSNEVRKTVYHIEWDLKQSTPSNEGRKQSRMNCFHLITVTKIDQKSDEEYLDLHNQPLFLITRMYDFSN